MLYNIVLVSAIQQHESATGIHMSPPSGTSLPPPTPSTPPGCHRAPGLSSLHRTADSHLPSILHTVVCMFPCCSLDPSHPLLPALRPPVCRLRLRLHSKWVHQYHLSRFHIYVVIHDICFSLSDFLHSVQ